MGRVTGVTCDQPQRGHLSEKRERAMRRSIVIDWAGTRDQLQRSDVIASERQIQHVISLIGAMCWESKGWRRKRKKEKEAQPSIWLEYLISFNATISLASRIGDGAYSSMWHVIIFNVAIIRRWKKCKSS
eukprot:3010246-Karenia_brevis.AAC.1